MASSWQITGPNLKNLTILIAVRNGEDYLEETLVSAIKISNELGTILLISDNHSDDKTKEIIGKHSSSFTLISPPKVLGMAEHWTWATSQVGTKYFRLVGHDDFLDKTNLISQVQALEANHFAIAAYSDRDYLLTYGSGRVVFKKSKGKRDHKIENQRDLLKSVIKTGTNGVGEPFCVTFRTELFNFTKDALVWSSRDPIYELETYFNALKYGELVFCEGKSGQYRIHPYSYSSSVSKYFWQASEHRKWVVEKLLPSKLTWMEFFTLHLTTRIRATIRAIIFWWIK